MFDAIVARYRIVGLGPAGRRRGRRASPQFRSRPIPKRGTGRPQLYRVASQAG